MGLEEIIARLRKDQCSRLSAMRGKMPACFDEPVSDDHTEMPNLLERWRQLTAAGETTPARHRFAIVLITVSSVGFSFAGLVIRSVEQADVWQLNLHRSVFMVAVIVGILIAEHGRQVYSVILGIGRVGLAVGVLIGIGPMLYLLAMMHTTVANTLFILATVPFFTAILAWLFLRERVRRSTWIAIAVAMTGIGIMVAEGISVGALFGNSMALLCALLFSVFAVVARAKRSIDMLPTLVIGGVVTGIIALIVSWPDLNPGLFDIWLCLIWGGLISGFLGNWLFLRAIRHLAAAEVTLLMMTEFVLGPVWVLLFVGEVPGKYTVLGGMLVLGAVGIRAWLDLRRDRTPRNSAAD